VGADGEVRAILLLVKDFRGPMETCSSLSPLPIRSKFNYPICHPGPPTEHKTGHPVQQKDRSYTNYHMRCILQGLVQMTCTQE